MHFPQRGLVRMAKFIPVEYMNDANLKLKRSTKYEEFLTRSNVQAEQKSFSKRNGGIRTRFVASLLNTSTYIQTIFFFFVAVRPFCAPWAY